MEFRGFFHLDLVVAVSLPHCNLEENVAFSNFKTVSILMLMTQRDGGEVRIRVEVRAVEIHHQVAPAPLIID